MERASRFLMDIKFAATLPAGVSTIPAAARFNVEAPMLAVIEVDAGVLCARASALYSEVAAAYAAAEASAMSISVAGNCAFTGWLIVALNCFWNALVDIPGSPPNDI